MASVARAYTTTFFSCLSHGVEIKSYGGCIDDLSACMTRLQQAGVVLSLPDVTVDIYPAIADYDDDDELASMPALASSLAAVLGGGTRRLFLEMEHLPDTAFLASMPNLECLSIASASDTLQLKCVPARRPPAPARLLPARPLTVTHRRRRLQEPELPDCSHFPRRGRRTRGWRRCP